MNHRHHRIMRVVTIFLLSWLTSGTAADSLGQATATERTTSPKVYRDTVDPNWLSDGSGFWYRNDMAGNTLEFVWVDAIDGTREPAFDHDRVARQLSLLTGRAVDATQLPIEMLFFNDDLTSVELLGTDDAWQLDLTSYKITESDGSADLEGLPFNRTPRPSRSNGSDTHVIFLNRWSATVKIFWIDGAGGHHQYGELAPGQRRRQHTFAGHVWLVTSLQDVILAVFEAPADEQLAIIDDREPTLKASPVPDAVPSQSSVPSPDGQWSVLVRDHNLWLREIETSSEKPLSIDGCANDSYRQDGQRTRLVEMDYYAAAPPDSQPNVVWSPDSRYLIARRTRAVTERTVYMVDSSPDDQLQPALQSYPYLKPGDDIPVGMPHLFDVQAGVQIPVDLELFANPWNITDPHWAPDGSECYFLYNQRGHQTMRVIAIAAPTGAVRTVVDEVCPTFFDYQGKTYLEHIETTDELVWMSERDGWNHLYLYDRSRAKVKKQITRGQWLVRGVDRINTETRQIWFRAVGIVPGEDPYHVHHCRVDFDGKNLTVLTAGDGTHRIKWSPDRRFLIDTWSRVDLPPVNVLRNGRDGSLVCELEQADASEVLAAGLLFPERFSATGRDGQTIIFGIIHRPANFDQTRSYPVIECIYAGPHGAHVPKTFRTRYRLQALADRGFVIVQIDGMGTNWRSKTFHDVCWRNLVDAGFEDRRLWIEAAADKYQSLDISRVGIYGGSAGGQNALGALLTHGDFYKVAVSDCGCHDNRMDKIWWNEQWMGYPIGPHYGDQSNVTLAPNLQGELLLIVGELDHNVDPASTMQVVDALIKADRDFDMLVCPGVGHGAMGTAYGQRRMQEFFIEHLLP